MATILRADIERALDDLIAHEEGMKFQSLAVVLAKARWAYLVASERKNDLGLDAYVSAASASDGIGRGLACSITPTLGKIKSDAEEAQKHFSDIRVLIFSTPSPVSNSKKRKWTAAIQSQFGYELTVISREDIISDLLIPANAALCRTFLGLNVPISGSVEGTIEQIRQSSEEVARTWAVRLHRDALIELHAVRLDDKGAESSDVLRLADIRRALRQSRRIVLAAPAGRGKTTTLVQLAQLDQAEPGSSSFLIDLPQWAAARTDILSYIAGMAPFRARGVDSAALAQAQQVEHFSFLLNGWNEVAASESLRAVEVLRDLERAYPAAGIIVATRTHHVAPPLPGAQTLQLLELTRRQRRDYLRARLEDRASALSVLLDGDPVLDDLTRTPFVLSEVTTLHAAGVAIPTSKIGVLREVMRLHEASHEHSAALQAAPLRGMQANYLGPLAREMTMRGAVSTPEVEARSTVSGVSRGLTANGQIAAAPEPADVLGTLCAHHILERAEYPTPAYRFAHQQFQEYYAALGVRQQLEPLVAPGKDAERLQFTRDYLNEPAWEEPLRMIAEALGVESREATAAADVAVNLAALLVRLALEADLVLAAEVARLCGERAWNQIGGLVEKRLRDWHSVQDPNHQQCALVGMVASGSSAFRDILLPLLTHQDPQLRLRSYRNWGYFHLSSLGSDWQTVVRVWPEEQRVSFVGEILHERYVPELVSFAVSDDSIKVRQAALSAVEWRGVEDEIARVIDSIKREDLDAVLLESAKHGARLPERVKPQAVDAVKRRLAGVANATERIRLLEEAADLGDPSVPDQLKDELARMPEGDVSDGGHPLRSAIEAVRAHDREFVSRWVAERVARGQLWSKDWMLFVDSVPDDVIESSLKAIEEEPVNRLEGLIAVLSAAATPAVARRVFDRIKELRTSMATAPDRAHPRDHEIARNLEAVFRSFTGDIAIEGLATSLDGEVDAKEAAIVVELFSNVARQDDERLAFIGQTSSARLRGYVKRAIPVILREDDFSGELKAHAAAALAHVGRSEDIADLKLFVHADIERVRTGREARATGEQSSRAEGAVMSYGHWHIQSLTHLGTAEADDFLLELLGEPEYERSVCEELKRRGPPQREDNALFKKTDYERIWQARANPQSASDATRRRYAEALHARVDALKRERAQVLEAASQAPPSPARPRRRGNDNPTARYDGRLKQFGDALAALDAAGSADLVLELMALPGDWDGWIRVDAAERLLFGGTALPSEPTLSLLDSTLNRQWGLQDQERWLVKRFLCICPYVDRPSEGFRKMREVLPKAHISWHDMRDVAMAVGHSRTDEALPYLIELAENRARLNDMEDAWVEAVAAVNSQASRDLLLSFVDPDVAGLPGPEVKIRRDDVLVSRIVELARRDSVIEDRLLRLCDRKLTGQRRELLATIIGWLGTSRALSAGLLLVDDALAPAVPWRLGQHLEAAFVERRRIESLSPIFSLVARESNALRLELCRMIAADPRRQASAFRLLGATEVWRLEYGRPTGEPRNPLLGSGSPWPPAEPQPVVVAS
ncbi:MAG TPA: hypothetical protein VI485_09070 [Vicinamibacterales bacterium]|nr:hypothetical protein [Vicinamibacterales bacterium]